jgi:DNA polymerase-3 subunit delta'
MIIGHQKQWQFLKKISLSGNIPHAFLFAGQERIGKKKVAFEWVSEIFKEKIGDIHPDFTIVEPEGKEIQISQIKELIRGLSLKPYSAPMKVALIDNAHLMNAEAQSCLLKTLEEPKGDTLLILVSDQPSTLLPTIISRLQTVKFYPVPKEEMKELGESLGIYAGSPGMALDFAKDPEKKISFEKKIKEIEEISKSDLCQRFEYAKQIAEESTDVREVLKIWMSYFRNILLKRVSEGGRLGKIKNILKSLQEADYLTSKTNVNTRLLLETLMIEF